MLGVLTVIQALWRTKKPAWCLAKKLARRGRTARTRSASKAMSAPPPCLVTLLVLAGCSANTRIVIILLAPSDTKMQTAILSLRQRSPKVINRQWSKRLHQAPMTVVWRWSTLIEIFWMANWLMGQRWSNADLVTGVLGVSESYFLAHCYSLSTFCLLTIFY